MFEYKQLVPPFVFILVLACMNCSPAFQPFELTRLTKDEFKVLTVTTCNSKEEYCTNREAQCRRPNGGCCTDCRCTYSRSTFDVSTLKCRKNTDFRSGCSWTFENVYKEQPIQLLNLSNKGTAKFTFTKAWNDQIKSCKIDSINMLSHDGKFYLVQGKVFKVVRPKKNEWRVEIKWDPVTQTKLHGKVFKVKAVCKIEKTSSFGRKKLKKEITKEGCFVFKSSGKLIVSPILSPSPTTSFSLSKTETSSKKPERPSAHILTPRFLPSSSSRVAQTVAVTSVESHLVEPTPVISSPNTLQTTAGFESHLVEPTPVISSPNTLKTTAGFETETSPDVVSPLFPITLPKSTKAFEVPEKITTEKPVLMPSSTSNIAEASESYVAPTAEEQSGGGGRTVIISSAVAICVLIIVGIVLLLLWSQRKKRRTSGQKQNNKGFTNKGATADGNNAMAMNNNESIYAEADDVVSSKCVSGKDHYSSLDKTIPEEISFYQPLHASNTNVYEKILEKKGPVSGPHLVTAPGDKHDESGVYCVLEDNNKVSTPAVAEAIYSDLDEFKGPGNERDERVYSVLEDDNKVSTPAVAEAIYSDLDEFKGPGNERNERVYSVLEVEDDDKVLTPPVAEAVYCDLGETCGQVLPARPADKQDESVYSVLEQNGPGNESSPATPDSDYLTVVHREISDYEQPVDVPMPDA